MLGRFLHLNKMKTKRLSNHMSQYFIHNRTYITKQMFKQSNICSPPDDVYFRKVYFGRTMLNHILHLLQLHGFVVEESGCWIGLPAVQIFHLQGPIENIWHIIKLKIRQRQPQTLQQLQTYIRQEWDQIPTPKLQKLITSMPRRLQTVLKRRGDATPWKTCPRPNYFETCGRNYIWNELILCMKFYKLSMLYIFYCE